MAVPTVPASASIIELNSYAGPRSPPGTLVITCQAIDSQTMWYTYNP